MQHRTPDPSDPSPLGAPCEDGPAKLVRFESERRTQLSSHSAVGHSFTSDGARS